MRRRSLGLALASLALTVPATAHAAEERAARVAEDYKVLVVTSTDDPVTTAGKAAIAGAGEDAGFTVTAPSAATVGEQFTAANLEQYRAVVFLGTGQASPLTAAQKTTFEEYFKAGGGFVGIGSAIETDPSWSFLSDALGTRAGGRTDAQSADVKVADRVHDATKSLPHYWKRSSDHFYNFTSNVRGRSHVLATVTVDPFGKQPQGKELDGIAGGTMGADHPVSWCKDFQGGRSFYTALGNTAAAFDAQMETHLAGAIGWAAGAADPVYSDCGATVLSNYEQRKVSVQPNLSETIGFDQFPDGRVIQTARNGTIRLHDEVTGTTKILADFGSPTVPLTQRVYTHSEDGMYGPAVDRNFEQNKWVYLFYSPQTVQDVKLSTGEIVTQTTPNTAPPNSAPSKTAWDPYVGYFQLSRFKFVEDNFGPRLDLDSEQQIMRVPVNRQECCHVAGDIDFDADNNLWMVMGDDTPAGGINAGGFGPFNDQKTDEQQTVRVTGATGGTFTLTYDGQTTAPIAYNATAADIDAALEALSNIGENEIQTSGGPVQTANVNVFFRRAKSQSDQAQISANGADLTGGTVATTTAQEGGWYQRPTGDARRTSANTNDLRGKLLKIKVKDGDIAAGEANKADFSGGTAGAYTIPAGNLFPLRSGAPQPKTRPEIHSMGFRNPHRLQVDDDGVAYVTDYSPDSQVQARNRGPAGTGRVEIVRKPSNYGWPTCYSTKLGYFDWDFHEFAPGTTSAGTNKNGVVTPIDCGAATQKNDSMWNVEGGPSIEPGLTELPPVTDPDIWYSYRDNNATAPLGTPCAAYYASTPGPIAPGSTTECPRLFPELFTGGVAPHGSDKYEFDPDNPNPNKFPPYYDGSVILGEFGQDTLREIKLDGDNHVQKINPFMNCTGVGSTAQPFECDNPNDMQFGDDGAFYLLTYGDGFFNANPDAGMYKWEYTKGKNAPIAALGTDRTSGPAPLTVKFSSEGTRDPDQGDSIVIEWDFGDGNTSNEANPTHTYTTPGRYTAILRVTDSTGKTTATSTPITVGNTAPKIEIDIPAEGGLFAFGDRIPFSVRVTDPEDGAVRCEDVLVTFVLGHDSHGHAMESKNECSGFLQTDPEDVFHGGNVFGVINVRYMDKGGPNGVPSLETVEETFVYQKKQQVEHVLAQSGTNTAANADEGGGAHRGSLGAGDWMKLNGSYNLANIDTISFRVADAAAGRTAGSPLAAVELRTGSQTGPLVATYDLKSTGSAAVWDTQTWPIALSGTNDLYLVFRTVTGGATGGNLFNLNYVEFGGTGATVVTAPPVDGTVGGSVPATLSLSLGAPATFGAFVPGVARTYEASTTANVISSAGDATLSVSNTGNLTNGAFSLAQPLQVALSKSTWSAPVSNETVDVTFKQDIGADEPLRTGAYSKTVTFTLSTTNP